MPVGHFPFVSRRDATPRRPTVTLVVIACLLPFLCGARAGDARQVVEAFVGRLAGVQIRDLTIHQAVTLYHAEGRFPPSTGEDTIHIKLPGRQRHERRLEGAREVRLTVGDRTWVRRSDGSVVGAASERDRTRLVIPAVPSAADLLAEWRALGIRDDVTSPARLRGRAVTVIGAEVGDRTSPAVWLDPEYGVVRLVVKERLGTGSDALVDLTFSEHRPLEGGAYFPYRQEAFMGGRLRVLVTVRSVAVNTNLPDALFDPATLRPER
jgi:hypothetical protein